MKCPEVVLRKGSERSLLNGHPWVYSGAVDQLPENIAPGGLVDLLDHRGRFIGRGYYNPHSSIRIRILTRDRNQTIDPDFFYHVIDRAYRLRQESPLPAQTDAYRIVHGESDGLPGLIVDQYAGHFVVQFHTMGIDLFREQILDAIGAVAKPQSIFERSDVGTRRAEGLASRPSGLLQGKEPPALIPITEHGVRLFVDVRNGQKTGFFLDQRQNRALLKTLVSDREVLDAFSYTSAFSAHALSGGARRTVDIDIAPSVLPAARHNLDENRPNGSRADIIIADVFQFLDDLARAGPSFDCVVLDPPSLLRKRSGFKKAMGVYIKLNRNALKLLKSGGLLVSASCSSRISSEDFFAIVQRAAASENVDLRILNYNLHAADHPVSTAFPEGRYLKCLFARAFRY